MRTLAPFWVALLVSALVALPIYRLLLALKSRQTVSQYAPEGHQKKQGTPTMGGLVIVVGALASIGAYGLLYCPRSSEHRGLAEWMWTAAILLVGFAAIGFTDDFVVPRLIKGKRGLGWKQKILMEFVVGLLATWMQFGLHASLQAGVFLFLVLFASNAYNFLDGLDALAGSVLIALSGGLLVLGAFAPLGPADRIVLHALVGATIPFLFLNAPPAKVFMGDVGSLPIGALLGMVISSFLWPSWGAGGVFDTPYSKLYLDGPGAFAWAMLVPCLIVGFVLIAELVPVPLQIFSVKVFKRKLFPYTPIHHAFEKAGWPESRVVWHFLLAQLVLAAIAYTVALRSYAVPPTSSSGYYYSNPGSSRP